MRWWFCLGAFALFLNFAPADLPAAETRCPFDEAKLEFSGSPLEQARCLLRPVSEFGRLGQPLAALPRPLESLIGQPVAMAREDLQRYLEHHHISEAEI